MGGVRTKVGVAGAIGGEEEEAQGETMVTDTNIVELRLIGGTPTDVLIITN